MVPWKRWEDPYKDDLFIVGSFIFSSDRPFEFYGLKVPADLEHVFHTCNINSPTFCSSSCTLIYILYMLNYAYIFFSLRTVFLFPSHISYSCTHTHTHTDTHVAKYTICSHTHTAGFTGRFASSHLINLSLWGGYGAALGLAHLTCSDTPSFSISLTPHNADLLLSGKRVIGLGRLGLKFWPPSNNHHLPGVWSLEEILWNIVWWLSAL